MNIMKANKAIIFMILKSKSLKYQQIIINNQRMLYKKALNKQMKAILIFKIYKSKFVVEKIKFFKILRHQKLL